MSRSLPHIALCHSNDIANDSGMGFEVDGLQLFAIKKRGQVFVYHNRCPHLGLPLNWLPDQFLDIDKELIQCSSHGALFRIDNGQCVMGPCSGQYLRAIAYQEIEGEICIDPQDLRT